MFSLIVNFLSVICAKSHVQSWKLEVQKLSQYFQAIKRHATQVLQDIFWTAHSDYSKDLRAVHTTEMTRAHTPYIEMSRQ